MRGVEFNVFAFQSFVCVVFTTNIRIFILRFSLIDNVVLIIIIYVIHKHCVVVMYTDTNIKIKNFRKFYLRLLKAINECDFYA